MSDIPPSVEVFYSYADDDAPLRDQLERHLSPLKREGVITTWHKRQILAGTDWAKALDSHLSTASVILLLISAEFVASDYCYGIEMQRALQRHDAGEAYVIPILLRPVDWQGAPFGKLTALPSNGKPIFQWRDRDAALVDVAQGIRKALQDLQRRTVRPSSTSFPRVWNIPYPRNPVFTGREDVLTRFADALKMNQPTALSQPQAIGGLGGIGKTHIAVEYAYRFSQQYQFVLWTRADTSESLLSGYVAIARQLNLPEKDEQDQTITVQAVVQWLSTHIGWLLILDNADDLAVARGFLPSVFGGHLVLTTRAWATGRLASRIEVEIMDVEVGALFLLRRSKWLAPDAQLEQARASDSAIARMISEELGGLPLALDQAGAYIEETQCSLADYLQRYRHRRSQLLQRRGGLEKDHPEPVATTWSLAFEQVEQRSLAASDLLRFCAFLHPDTIPEEIITKGAAHLGPCLSPAGEDPLLLDEAVAVLGAYSLVHRNAKDKTLRVHRLIQAVVKDKMSVETYRQWAERTVQAVNEAFPESELATWPLCQQLLPHAQCCRELIQETGILFPEAAHVLHQAGGYAYERGLHGEAEMLLLHALALREQVLGTTHLDTLMSLNAVALLYREEGKYEQAEALLQRALPICEQVQGAIHPDTASTANNLALLYQAQGKYKQAEPLFQRALDIREQVLGETDFDTAQSLSNLAGLYDAQGNYAHAELLHQRALAIYGQVVHPRVIHCLNNVAASLSYQGKYEQAESFLQRALAMSEQMLGPTHPTVATNVNNLGMLYRKQMKLEQAEPLLQRALKIREEVLGPLHTDTASSLNNVALLLYYQKRYRQAELLLQRALEINTKALDPHHPSIATNLNNIAKLCHVQEKYEEAESFYERAFAIRELQLGLLHPDTLATLESYSQLLRTIGQEEKAIQLEERLARASQES